MKSTTKQFFVNSFLMAVGILLLTSQLSMSQYGDLPGSKKKKPVDGRQILGSMESADVSHSPEIQYSQSELEIVNRMSDIKQNESGTGEELVQLQKQLERSNGATVTKNAESSFCKMVPASGKMNLSSTDIYNGLYIGGTEIQTEQRGSTAGRIWVAVGVSDGDTGVAASPDTLILYYSDNGGDSYSQYVRTVFSAANKINFDDLDMEIIEPASGDKYIYMVFGYTTLGYRGQNLVGYTIVRTPTLAVFGSTMYFPGYNTANKYFKPKISTDNAKYASVPYVFITLLQDSTDGVNTYSTSKHCYILNPYSMNPALTYLPLPFLGPYPASGLYGMCLDIAFFNNGQDSLMYVLSERPGFQDKMYIFTANSLVAGYPIFKESLTPTGNDIKHARIAANGGDDQKKIAIIYSENYNNSGDWDQYVIRTSDRMSWAIDNFEFSSVYSSGSGQIIGRRGADGSFAMAFKNTLGSLENVTYATYNGDFSVPVYVHRANPDYANSFPSPKPAFRFVNGDSCLYNWNYYYTARSSSKCSDIGLYLRYAIEGFYDDVNDVHSILDVVYVYLADPSPPHNYVDTAVMYLDHQLLLNEAAFYNAPAGSYYVVLKHRNALQTWSAAPVSIDDTPGFYDFTAASANAFGDNMTLKGTRWCLFSGDVNQDETIDGTDLQEIDNDAYNFIFGQLLNTDLNGDDFVDGGDYLLADNNAANFISLIRP